MLIDAFSYKVLQLGEKRQALRRITGYGGSCPLPPQDWTDDPTQRAAAHGLPGSSFATKPRLALAMIERVIAADVPFSWVAGDSIYGVGEIEMTLRGAGKDYVLGVNVTHAFNSRSVGNFVLRP